MAVDIVIPSRTEDPGIFELLSSIQNLNQGLIGAVHIVFNPKLPTITPKSGNYPFQIKLHSTPQLNANIARNIGLKNCTGDFAILIDSDCVITNKYFLEDYMSAFEKYPKVQVIGGGYVIPENSSVVVRAYHWLQMDWYLNGQKYDNMNCNLLGGNLAIRKEIYQQFLFNETIRFGAAETEYIYRLHHRGVIIFGAPEITVLHKPIVHFWGLLSKAFAQGYNTEGFVERFPLHEPEVNPSVLRHRMNLPSGLFTSLCLWGYRNVFLYGRMSRTYGKSGAVIAFIIHHARGFIDRILNSVEFISSKVRRLG